MAYTHTMTIKEFMQGNQQKQGSQVIPSLIAHLKRNKMVYRIIGTTIFIFLIGTDVSFAASTGIDAGADKIYRKLVNIGKWVIIIKGGIDTIKTVADGDFHAAKKNFLGYGVTYAILWGLPWMMKEIEHLFSDMGA